MHSVSLRAGRPHPALSETECIVSKTSVRTPCCRRPQAARSAAHLEQQMSNSTPRTPAKRGHHATAHS
eukprot:9204659-Alexandrium_andersonii.AAC.1